MFWMDTLCIPTSDAPHDSGYHQDIKALKQKAIKYMTPFYAGATDVLVLDSELQSMYGTVLKLKTRHTALSLRPIFTLRTGCNEDGHWKKVHWLILQSFAS